MCRIFYLLVFSYIILFIIILYKNSEHNDRQCVLFAWDCPGCHSLTKEKEKTKKKMIKPMKN